ncbi:MAG TPA: hypothetical protein VNC17_00255, partial [Thermoleophilaceae bacterium]|nr:hypothetical protein [Thermoleophilaceae bacterium]
CAVDTVQLRFEVGERTVRTRVGPLSEQKVSEALENGERPPGELTLRRVLQTVVDSFAVDQSADGDVTVLLEKLKSSP